MSDSSCTDEHNIVVWSRFISRARVYALTVSIVASAMR